MVVIVIKQDSNCVINCCYYLFCGSLTYYHYFDFDCYYSIQQFIIIIVKFNNDNKISLAIIIIGQTIIIIGQTIFNSSIDY